MRWRQKMKKYALYDSKGVIQGYFETKAKLNRYLLEEYPYKYGKMKYNKVIDGYILPSLFRIEKIGS